MQTMALADRIPMIKLLTGIGLIKNTKSTTLDY